MSTIEGMTLILASLLLPAALAMAEAPSELLSQPWYPKAPPLPKPTGQVLKAASAEEIREQVAKLTPGGTLLIADGHYLLNHLEINVENVTLRSESGNRTKVVIDGDRGPDKTFAGELVRINRAGITLADLTIANGRWNGFKIAGEASRTRLYNCVAHNVWQRAIKGVHLPDGPDGQKRYVTDCQVRYCLIYNDRPKKFEDDPEEGGGTQRFGGNYIGGMDVMQAKGWVVADNVFVGIKGRTVGGRGAIFMWVGSEDCTVERNIIIDCDRGICIGNPSGQDTDRIRHATRFLVRNNFVALCPGNAIEFDWTRDCRFIQNTVHCPTGRTVAIYGANDGLTIANNILSGREPTRQGTTGEITITGNLNRAVPEYFRDPAHGDLHLTAIAADAIGKATAVKDCPEDIDGQKRGPRPDLGADQRDQ